MCVKSLYFLAIKLPDYIFPVERQPQGFAATLKTLFVLLILKISLNH